jgi:mycofactocin biosynthesis protein MftB
VRGLLIAEPTHARPAGDFDPTRPYALHPRVALRPESFGALAYHYGNRRLNFLRSHDLVRLVEGLDAHPSVEAALDATGLGAPRRPDFLAALRRLAASEFIMPSSGAADEAGHEAGGDRG